MQQPNSEGFADSNVARWSWQSSTRDEKIIVSLTAFNALLMLALTIVLLCAILGELPQPQCDQNAFLRQVSNNL